MELTIIETSAYQELRRLVSTTNEWMRRTCVWLWAYRNGAYKTIGTTGLFLTQM